MSTLEYQRRTAGTLRSILRLDVEVEWDVAKNSQDAYTRRLYCPRLDIAVGPFNIDTQLEVNQQRFAHECNLHRSFIERLKENADRASAGVGSNDNPRCFIAIEIERTGTRKHRLGSILNAGALGKLGIVVGWDRDVTQSLTKICDYLHFLWQHEKVPEQLDNALVISKEKFSEVLDRACLTPQQP